MTNVVCLLSQQHVPNLISVHHFRPDWLVLVETGEMKRREVGAHFLKALRLGGLDYTGRCEIAPLDAEDSLAAARLTVSAAYDKHPGAQWIANITGGTKPMSLASYTFFKEKGARSIYISVSKAAELIDVDTQAIETCGYRPSISEFLAGYGFECGEQLDRVAGRDGTAQSRWSCARSIAAHAGPTSILQLYNDDRSRAREGELSIRPSNLHFPSQDVRELVGKTLHIDLSAPLCKLSASAANFLTGGWLEAFFWGLVHKHRNGLGCWDVRLGLEVHRHGDPTLNELDVAFMHDHNLSIIECKSGTQGHDQQGDILYKVEAVARQFRALRVRSFLATTAENILDHAGELKRGIQTRAKEYNCRVLTAADIRSLANRADEEKFVRTTLLGDN
jgi:hypothetical protein